MATQVVKVRKEVLAACMTCPLCNKLLRDATTISECLHTFCRKCIYEKLTDEDEEDCCPICNIDLGCIALEKLRIDHNLQDIRSKIFPLKRKRIKECDITTPVQFPVRRKERSLSSLGVSTPRVSAQTNMIGKRTKSIVKKTVASKGLAPTIDGSMKREEDAIQDSLEDSSSSESLRKVLQNKKQSSNPSLNNNVSNNDAISLRGKEEIWNSLNYLVEAANRSKNSKFDGSCTKEDILGCKTKPKGPLNKIQAHVETNGSISSSSKTIGTKRMHGSRRRRAMISRELNASSLVLFDAAGADRERKTGPIWLSLIASDQQEISPPLPQIAVSYLRIKDSNLPVSFIQTYLQRKLSLANENEVEITCRGQPVNPSSTLQNLVDLWIQSSSSEKIYAMVGSSAKDFVMVLSYTRKSPPP